MKTQKLELLVANTFVAAIFTYFLGDLISTFHGFELGFMEGNHVLNYYFGNTPIYTLVLMKLIIIFYFFVTTLFFLVEKRYAYAFINSFAMFLIGFYATIINFINVFLSYI